VPVCDATTQARFTAALTKGLRDRLAGVGYNTSETEGRPDSFHLPVADWGALFDNKDATYVIATAPPFKVCSDPSFVDPYMLTCPFRPFVEWNVQDLPQGQGQDEGKAVLLARISGRLPLTARAAGSGGSDSSSRAVGRASGWEVRYLSFSSVDLADGKPAIDGLSDADIEAFHNNHSSNDRSTNG
jgi:hypothetical protein